MIVSATELKSALYRMLIASGIDVGTADDIARAGAYGAGLGLPVCAEILGGLKVQRPDVEIQDGALIWKGVVDLTAIASSVDMLQSGQVQCVSAEDIAAPSLASVMPVILAPELTFQISAAGLSLMTCNRDIYKLKDISGSGFKMSVISKPSHLPEACKSRSIEIEDKLWQDISAIAAKSYVEATEASRASGAGAGLTDND